MTHPVTADIPVQRPFHGGALLAFLAARAVTGVEHVTGRTYTRTLRLAHGPGVMRVQFPPEDRQFGPEDSPDERTASTDDTHTGPIHDTVTATLYLTDPADAPEALRRCRHLLGAQAPAAEIDAALTADPALRTIVKANAGLRVPGTVDGPEILVRALLGQQVSVAAARTALSKLTHRADERLPSTLATSLVHDGGAPVTHLFPSPASLADFAVTDIGCPRARATALVDVAADIARGTLVVEPSRAAADLTADLVARRGIGPWTAGYVCLRVLADPDILLVGDLAIRRGAAALGLPDGTSYLKKHGETWRPFRSFAGMYLWRAAAGTG